MQLDTDQLAAVEMAVTGPRLVAITGGAGTGKTTIIRHILDRLPSASLVAFAGKAAARASEATGYPASTIHRFLGYQGEDLGFTRDSCPWPVILDEASMVDSALFAEIVRTCPPRLIVVGDASQLPPVGPGQPFHDVLRFRPDLVHTLGTCYRASGAVHHASQMIRAGQVPGTMRSGGEAFSLVPTRNAAETHRYVLGLAERGILDPCLDLVVCPRNGEEDQPGTRQALNRDLHQIYNRLDADAPKFRPGDRVINGKNFGKLDYWNGDTGTVVALDSKGMPEIKLDREREDGLIQIGKDQIRELDHAYCLTIHKSQGSQYRRVVVVLRDQDSFQLDRRMVYTAVTRAREGCVVVGSVSAFRAGIASMRERQTVIQQLARG